MEENRPIFNVSSNNQSGGITAGIVNVGPKPRKLVDSNSRNLLEQLSKDKKIKILSGFGDTEAADFAQQTYDFLKANGYNVISFGQTIFSKHIPGQHIENNGEETTIYIGPLQ